jgi:hypothetical protein
MIFDIFNFTPVESFDEKTLILVSLLPKDFCVILKGKKSFRVIIWTYKDL